MAGNHKTILLTGASRGIGHATVKRFSEAGWRVVTSSREEVPAECKRDPNWTEHITADLSEPQAVEGFIGAVKHYLGDEPLDALVNNAGISPKSPVEGHLGCLNGDLADWRHVFQLNFFTPLSLARGLSQNLAKGKGAIVNVTSIAGHTVHPFAGSAYSTSKAALSALTREMASEFAEFGVRVNAVAPTYINTPLNAFVKSNPAMYDAWIGGTPMGRFGESDEIASVVLFLASAASSLMTGSIVLADGGYTCW